MSRDQRAGYIEAGLAVWMQAAAKRPRVSIATIMALALAGFIYASVALKVDTDASGMINPDLPWQSFQLEFDRTFPQLADQIFVVVRGSTPDEADLFVTGLKQRLETSPLVKDLWAPAADPFFRQNALLYLEPGTLDRTLARLSAATPLLGTVVKDPTYGGFFDGLAENVGQLNEQGLPAPRVLLDGVADVFEARLEGQRRPFSWQKLVRPDGGEGPWLSVLTLTARQDFTKLQPAQAIYAEINDAISWLRSANEWNIETGVTGPPILRMEEFTSITRGIGISFAISLALVTGLLFLTFRTWALTLTSLAGIVASLMMTAGFAALSVGALNLVSITFVVLLLGLGVDFAIHLGLHLREALTRGEKAVSAFACTAREIGLPLALTMPTTALAFLAFAPTDFTGMAELGIIAAGGVVIAFFTSITIVAAAFSLKAPPPVAVMDIARTSGRPLHLQSVAAVVIIIAALASLWVVRDVRFNSDPMALRNPDSASVTAFNWMLADPDFRPWRASALAPDRESGLALAARIEELDEVREVLTLSSFVPGDQDIKLDVIDFASFGIVDQLAPPPVPVPPADPVAALERLRDALTPYVESGDDAAMRLQAATSDILVRPELIAKAGSDIMRYWPLAIDTIRNSIAPQRVGDEDVPRFVRERYLAADGRYRLEIIPEAGVEDGERRRAFIEAVRTIEPKVAGDATSIVRSGNIVEAAMVEAGLGALVLVFCLLLLVLRDALLSVVILLPVVLAAILTAAIAVLAGLDFNYANVIVLPLLIGLGIDSGIHMGLRARESTSTAELMGSSTPRAVVFSALTSLAAFGSLTFSEHPGTSSMGQLLALAMAMTVISTLFVLPSAIKWLQALRKM